MKRENEFAVGLAVIAAFCVVVGGALWLSGAHLGRTEAGYTGRLPTRGGTRWPGATLPDIGQLTAQASRIATDIATVANRVQTAFDSTAVSELRRSIRDFGQVADRLAQVTNEQAGVISRVGTNLRTGSDVLAQAATNLPSTLGRRDSATDPGQLAAILNNTAAASHNVQQSSQDLRDLLDAAHRNQERPGRG